MLKLLSHKYETSVTGVAVKITNFTDESVSYYLSIRLSIFDMTLRYDRDKRRFISVNSTF